MEARPAKQFNSCVFGITVLLIAPDTRVTVRIEEEAGPATPSALTDNPMFGMWRDREEMADVNVYARKLRAPRYRPDGSRNDEGQ